MANNVADIIEQRVSSMVTETLIQESVMLRAMKDFTSQVGPGMDTLKVPLYQEMAVQDVITTGDVTAQDIIVATDNLALDQFKSVPFVVQDELSIEAKGNLVQEAVKNGARSLAAEIDNYSLGLLDAGASTAAPDHRLALTASPLDDISNASRLLDVQNVSKFGRTIVASPGFMASLRGDTNVINAEKYGSVEPIQAGFITKLYGFNILESSSASIQDGGFIAFIPDTIGFAMHINARLKSEYRVLAHRWDYSLSQKYGAKVLDSSGKRIVVYDADGA